MPRAPKRQYTRRISVASSSDPSITHDEARGALQEILQSSDFPATLRNRKFLAYITEKTLSGEYEHVTSYHVATKVFGRPPSFDSTADPIVRVEARKLRRDLDYYYLQPRRKTNVRISMPLGGYIVVFQRHSPLSDASAPVKLNHRGVTIHALHGPACPLAGQEPCFRGCVADVLSAADGLHVFAGPVERVAPDGLLDSDMARDLARRNATRFILSGFARRTGAGVVFTARLHDGETGRQLWAEDLDGDLTTLAARVGRRVAAACESLSGSFDPNWKGA